MPHERPSLRVRHHSSPAALRAAAGHSRQPPLETAADGANSPRRRVARSDPPPRWHSPCAPSRTYAFSARRQIPPSHHHAHTLSKMDALSSFPCGSALRFLTSTEPLSVRGRPRLGRARAGPDQPLPAGRGGPGRRAAWAAGRRGRPGVPANASCSSAFLARGRARETPRAPRGPLCAATPSPGPSRPAPGAASPCAHCPARHGRFPVAPRTARPPFPHLTPRAPAPRRRRRTRTPWP